MFSTNDFCHATKLQEAVCYLRKNGNNEYLFLEEQGV